MTTVNRAISSNSDPRHEQIIKRTLIVTAVEAEKEAVLRGLGSRVNVDVLAGGVGPIAAAAKTAEALAAVDYSLVISAGIGGGFAGQAEVGSVVVATMSVSADLGVETADAFLSFEELGFGTTRFQTDGSLAAPLVSAMAAAGLSVSSGPVLTVSTATGTAANAAILALRVPGAAVEAMEGYGVATAAHNRGIPFLEIRTISNQVGPRRPGCLAHWRCTAGTSSGKRSHSGGATMRIAFSPCPNDTFIFHALVHGLIPGAPKLDVTYADIDITNKWAAGEGGSDVPEVMKISYAALPWISSDYALLPCGGALGRGCGPLVLTQNGSKSSTDLAALAGKRIAVPSDKSTAYLLFRLWAAQQVQGGVGEIVVMPFHEIMPAVRDGLIDAGLVIHEARFTYHKYGLHLLTDLGSWWEEDTGLPIPLGAIIGKRSLALEQISKWIIASVEYAWAHPEVSKPYIMNHAQELSPEVAEAHIDLYVNEFSANLGDDGYAAIEALLGRAAKEGLVPAIDLTALRPTLHEARYLDI